MKAALKVVAAALVAVMLLLLGAVSVFLLASDETRKEWLIAATSYSMNRELAIDGDFRMTFGSTTALQASEIRVENAEWGAYPALFQARQLDASVSLWPLLKGFLDFKLFLVQPELTLETSESGTGNWQLGGANGESTGSGLPVMIVPREISVSDGKFSYHEHGAEKPDEAEIKRLYLATLENQQTLELEGHFNGLPLTLKSDGSQAGETGGLTRLSVTGQLGKLNIRAAGSFNQSGEAIDPELDLAIAVDSTSLRFVNGQLVQRLPDLGPLKARARLHGTLSALALEGIEANLDSDQGKLKASGAIGNVANLTGFDIDLDADTTKLMGLMKALALNPPFELPPKAQAQASLSGDWPALTLGEIEVKLTKDAAKTTVTGRIGKLPEFDEVDLLVKINAPALADVPIYQYVHAIDLPGLGPVKGSSRVNFNDGVWSATETRIDIENDNGWIRYKSDIADLATLRGWDARLDAKINSLTKLQATLPAGAAKLGQVEFHAVLKEDPPGSGKLGFRAETTSEKLKLVSSGSIDELLGKHELAFDFDLSAEQLSDIGVLAELGLPDTGPVQCSGRLVSKGDVIKLDRIKARAGKSDIRGHFAFSLSGRHEADAEVLGGRLTSGTLDLDELIPQVREVEFTVLEKDELIDSSVEPSTQAAQRLFPADPLPLEGFRQFRTHIELEVGRLITGHKLYLDNLQIVFELVDDVLTLGPVSTQVEGKPVSLEMQLDASKNPAAFSLTANGDDVGIMPAGSVSSKPGLDNGEVSFRAELRGEGDSPAAIMASLDGTLAMGVAGIRLNDVPANQLGKSILTQINPVQDQTEANALECVAVYFQIEDGIATTPRGLAAQFEDVTWLGNGQINLATERIQISARPRARKGLGVGLKRLASLVLLGGTLAQPYIQIDPVGVVGAYGHYAAAISTGGLSLILTSLFEKSQANERVCLQIMQPPAETKAGSTKPKSPPKQHGPSELLDGD